MRKADPRATRIPVHAVTGTASAEALALIRNLCLARPDWLGLVDALPPAPPPNVRPLASGCPCCTGALVLQVSLVRLLRETGARRALVQVAPAHAASLEAALAKPPFDLSIRAAGRIELPAAAGLRAEDLESAAG